MMAVDPLNPQNLTPKPPALPQPYGTASVEQRVADLTSKDSPLNQAARTEAAKAMNARGMLNSSMTAGAGMDAVIRAAVPIASQDAAQAFQGSENALGRTQELTLQVNDIASRERMQGKDIASQQLMQQRSLTSAEQSQIRDIRSREGQAAADRALEKLMQEKNIASQEKMQQRSLSEAEEAQIRDIRFKQGDAAADRAQQKLLQARDIANQQKQQQADIKFQSNMKQLDRSLQEKLTSWDLKSSDRNAAAQMLLGMEQMYQYAYNSIMANTNLDAATRTAQLTAAKQMRDRQLNLTEQMYNINLTW